MDKKSDNYQSFKYHWENDGKWSCYVYGDEFRFTHKRNDGMIGYGRFPFDESVEVDKLPVVMEYVKEKDVIKCIRCGRRNGGQFRTDYNDAFICDRCYDVIKSNGDGNEFYEITNCGFKGSKIKEG